MLPWLLVPLPADVAAQAIESDDLGKGMEICKSPLKGFSNHWLPKGGDGHPHCCDLGQQPNLRVSQIMNLEQILKKKLYA